MFGGTQSENTKKLYMHNLQKLNDGIVPTDTKFLKKSKVILDKIKEMQSRNTARTYLIAIVSAVKQEPKLYAIYYPHLEAINAELKNNTTKSEKQTENWMSWDEVIKKQGEMMQYIPKKSVKVLPKQAYNNLLDLVILSLYSMQPPRRIVDYTLMKWLPDGDKAFNYLDKGNFIFHNYKTKKAYETQTIPVPSDFIPILKAYLRFKPECDWFLCKQDGKPLSGPDMTKRLNTIFGKKVSVSMLRNIYLSSKYSEVVQNLKDDTSAMGTSTNIALTQYIKE